MDPFVFSFLSDLFIGLDCIKRRLMLGFQKFSFNLSVCCLQWNATLEYYFIHFYGQSLSNSKAAATTRARTAKNPRRKNLRYISSNLFPYLSDEVTRIETFLTVHSSLIINNTRNNICLFTIDNIIVHFLCHKLLPLFRLLFQHLSEVSGEVIPEKSIQQNERDWSTL